MKALLGRWFGGGRAPAPVAAATPPATDAADQHLRAGNAAIASGDAAAAQRHFEAAVAAAPGNAIPHLNLGFVLLETGRAAAARASLQQAVALGGGADASYLLGRSHAVLEDLAAACESFEQAIAAREDFGFAWRDLGMARERLGQAEAALAAYQRARLVAPDLADAVAGAARVLLQLGRHAEAVDCAQQWCAASPDDWSAHFTQGQALLAVEQSAPALAELDVAASLAPDQAVVHYVRGNCLFKLARFEEAAQAYGLASAAAPGWPQPWMNCATALDRLGRFDEAIAWTDKTLAQEPGNGAAIKMRAMLLLSAHRAQEALDTLERARGAHPGDANLEWAYAFGHHLAGDMDKAWPAFEARWRAGDIGVDLKKHPFPGTQWTGQPLSGKTLLLYPEQGYGDILQFIRFVPELERRGARVLLWLPGPLVELASSVSSGCVVRRHLEELPAFDFHCPLMSVPHGLRTTLATLPAAVPYLQVDAGRRREWAERLGPRRGLRVGVVWSGNPAQKNDPNRSIPLELFSGIAVPGCEFFSLLNAVRPSDESALRAWTGLRHYGDDIRTFADSAALAAEMDLVISVCTSGAHLAGALGLPLWVLLCFRADWRWLLDRDDSPWYPTARLFRQDGSRDWRPVIARVRAELVARAEAASATSPAGV